MRDNKLLLPRINVFQSFGDNHRFRAKAASMLNSIQIPKFRDTVFDADPIVFRLHCAVQVDTVQFDFGRLYLKLRFSLLLRFTADCAFKIPKTDTELFYCKLQFSVLGRSVFFCIRCEAQNISVIDIGLRKILILQ